MFRHSEEGAAAVEFAIILPLLVVLVMGIVEFSRAYGAKEALQHGAREGARVMALTNNSAAAKTAAVNGAIGLNPALTTGQVTTTSCPVTPTPTSSTKVVATYPMSYKIPLWGSGTWTLSATGVMRCNG